MIKLNLQNDQQKIRQLKCGQQILLSGKVFTARDAVHKKFHDILSNGKNLPIDIKGKTVYYAGPCPAPNGKPIGSIGPTSSYRMDIFTPELLNIGLSFMIGKGGRSQEVIDSMIKNNAVYFTAIGGAGALYAHCVKKCTEILYPELLAESVKELEIDDFPVIVAIDSKGNSIY